MNTIHITENKKRLAFVVHPEKKTELVEWSYFNKNLLQQHEIIASGEAAKILEGTLHIPVTTFLTSSYEGYAELNNLVAEGKVDAIILFWDKDEETPLQRNGIRELVHTALEADIIIANNKVTADFIITSPLMAAENGGNNDEVITLKKNNAA